MAPVPGSGKNMHKSLVIVFPEAVLYNSVKCKKVHLLIRVSRKRESSKLKIGPGVEVWKDPFGHWFCV